MLTQRELPNPLMLTQRLTKSTLAHRETEGAPIEIDKVHLCSHRDL